MTDPDRVDHLLVGLDVSLARLERLADTAAAEADGYASEESRSPLEARARASGIEHGLRLASRVVRRALRELDGLDLEPRRGRS